MPTVAFSPSGLRGTVDRGRTILDVARALGVDLDSVCGGRGICGRCQVVAAGDGLSTPGDLERAYRGRRPLAPGARLGCAARVMGDVHVEVPPESQLHRPVVRKAVDLGALVVDPVVTPHYVVLPDLALGGDVSEARLLLRALADEWARPDLELGHEALLALQPALARSQRAVTVAVHDRTVVTGVWPGLVDELVGVAIDVGSTTLAGHLVSLGSGAVLASAGAMNPQIRFGEDLMSRVSYVMLDADGRTRLTSVIQEAVRDLVAELCRDAGVGVDAVADVVVVANPIMHHLLLGLDPTPLGAAPFALATDLPVDAHARVIGLDCPFATLHVLPCIAGHVGADAAGAVLAAGPHRGDDTVLLIDVGTNAEIVLGNREWLLAASSPTGPAFEGAQLSCGQRATVGAIERVRVDPQTLEPTSEVIGPPGTPATGVCGSGIIGAIAQLFLAGVIDADGTIQGGAAVRSDRVVPHGRTFAYVLHRDPELRITQGDVRAVQLAKAALHAGARLLLDRAGLETVDAVLLAGAFGSHIDPLDALVLGLIPDCEPERVRAIGNAAGAGAVRALVSRRERDEIAAVARRITKVETAIEPAFQEHFVRALPFPHGDDRYERLGRVLPLPRRPERTRRRRAGVGR